MNQDTGQGDAPGGTGPYLSLVVTARNDDHGGNLLARMQAFTTGWIEQAGRHGIPSELIIVEWNPPPDRPRLAEALALPADPGPCEVRFIEVPPELHNTYAHAGALPLYQMIAKNAGIRRARGRFVLATNIDILFSDELAAYLAERKLDPGRMYRIDRHDVESAVSAEPAIEQKLAYCRAHLIRVNAREGTFRVSPEGHPVLSPGDIAPPDSGILFGKGWLPVERYTAQEPFRWAGQKAVLTITGAPEPVSALVVELEPGPGTGGEPLDLEILGDGGETLGRVTVDRRSRLRLPLTSPLPKQLRFEVHKGGLPAERDPRILNFRVFQMGWERTQPRRGARAPSVLPVRRMNRVAELWFALQHVIDRLAKGGRLVPLMVPVSPRLRRMLKFYVEWRGFAGMARNVAPYLKRRSSFQRRMPPGSDIFPGESGLVPGAGWKKLDDYRGEWFREVQGSAELIVPAWAPDHRELGLQVQASKAWSLRRLELVLRDEAGKTLGDVCVAGLTFARLAVPPRADRTRVLRLEFRDPDAATENGEPEVRVFWCGWAGSSRAPAPKQHLALPWGAGWRWEAATGAMAAVGGPAEVVVRLPGMSARPLFLDVETADAADFEVRDSGGAVLAAFAHSGGREIHAVNLALEPGRSHVLGLAASTPFRAYGCGWNEKPGATAPVCLHTNGCGDFTLLARERWSDLRGYPEFDLFSMNLDSVLCNAAHYGGAQEEVLEEPMRIYHIEHGTGSGWTPEGQARLFERIAAKGLSFLANEDVLAWGAQMSRLESPMIFNHENWGLADFELKETTLPNHKIEVRGLGTALGYDLKS